MLPGFRDSAIARSQLKSSRHFSEAPTTASRPAKVLAQTLYTVHTEGVYRIHVAAEQAGVSTQLVRAWERRYGLLEPTRTQSGYRLYSDEDVAVLRGAKTLVDQGRSISEVARLSRAELKRIGSAGRATRSLPPTPSSETFLDLGLKAIADLDGARLESLLLHASGMGAMSSVEVCDRLLMPLLTEIGDRWEKGELDIAAEHFGSGIVRRHLELLVQDESKRNAGAPIVVCACQEGDLHEGGLLAFALHAAVAGWAILYLGANTPVDDLVMAANRSEATAVAVASSQPQSRSGRRQLIEQIASWKGKLPGRAAWAGGRAAMAHAAEFTAAGIQVLADPRELPARRSPVRPTS